ncbi:hypothetical protein Cni_G02149 [Canna indica]|uniref:Uncharacterized protein n=1 Tax=Canna indica TaxID=4628 RepID=A0AAQ3JQF8_9LILI|nr:hypothetical protein Cni_G02149 [Canna indica]
MSRTPASSSHPKPTHSLSVVFFLFFYFRNLSDLEPSSSLLPFFSHFLSCSRSSPSPNSPSPTSSAQLVDLRQYLLLPARHHRHHRHLHPRAIVGELRQEMQCTFGVKGVPKWNSKGTHIWSSIVGILENLEQDSKGSIFGRLAGEQGLALSYVDWVFRDSHPPLPSTTANVVNHDFLRRWRKVANPIVFELHCHSNRSDNFLAPAAVVK